ncbi:hypothetical protein ABZ341_32535 [Streptomyces sp. NPDC006173]|uniref:hypothetical protein n=1 Tax=Streptomyces sp. NPDC006173 TaxID=3155349 RepID=UPI0033ED7111
MTLIQLPSAAALTASDGTLCAMDKRSLQHIAGRFREAEQRTEILRQELAEAIRQADADGLVQKDICEVTGYTRQQVRRIVQAGNDDQADSSATA